jgi:hypothetical protein
MLARSGNDKVMGLRNAAQYVARVWDRLEGVGSLGGRHRSGAHRLDVASHAWPADTSTLSPLALVDALLGPNCETVAWRRGALR